jgi:predicted regulator of Ras-like GTPase activity (Roadblock/LC7/MglB family)
MFGFFKNLLRRPAENPGMIDIEETAAPVAAATEPTELPVAVPVARPVARPVHRPSAPRRSQLPQSGSGVEIPLQKVLGCLPLELQPRIRVNDVGDITITVPLEKILAQLSRGSVKIAFGELRSAAPEVFTSANDRDRVMVSLPLSEILPRLNPALIQRRRVQKTVEVPEDIRSPFDETGMGLVLAMGPEAMAQETTFKARTPAPAPKAGGTTFQARQTMPAAPAVTPPPVPPQAPSRISLTSAPTPPPPTVSTPSPSVTGTSPTAFKKPFITPPASHSGPAAPSAPASIPFNRPPSSPAPAPAPLVHRQPEPFGSNGSNGKAGSHAQVPVPDLRSDTHVSPAASKSTQEPIMVTLVSLAEGWPDVVRKEIVDWGLVEARVALPFEAVEQGLKQGRVAFTWKIMRSWTRPAPRQGDSPNDSVLLELPLKLVAPLYFVRQRENGTHQQKVAVDDEIPNLFFGFPQPEQSVAAPRPNDSNFYVWDDGAEMLRGDDDYDTRSRQSPGTQFMAKYATPNEIVSRAAGLEGVAGALIALPDGLMVANSLPPDLNGETLAAFLPQIFGKVSACTKELRMGELNNLHFTVGNVPWKIFRVNAIFFAAFGRAGESLPTAQLAALAADLDHKPK